MSSSPLQSVLFTYAAFAKAYPRSREVVFAPIYISLYEI